jgi:hypothetical protein
MKSESLFQDLMEGEGRPAQEINCGTKQHIKMIHEKKPSKRAQ